MADSLNWWLNRSGSAAAATVSSYSPKPEFGVAFDLGMANMSPGQFDTALNGVQTYVDDQATAYYQRQQSIYGMTPQQTPFGEVLVDGVEAPPKEDNRWFGAKAADAVGGFFGRILEPIKEAVGDDDTSGRSEEELKDLREKIAEDNDKPVQREDINEAIATGVEFVDTALATPAMLPSTNVGDGSFSSLLSGSNWREAWERASHTSFGRAWIDPTMREQEEIDASFRAGFDEFGMPRDAAMREQWESDTAFNLLSGSMDFLKVWYTDPLVIGGKGLQATRANLRGDFTALGRGNAARVREVVSAPAEHLDAVSRKIPKWDIAGQNALRLRRRMDSVRDDVRAGNRDVVDLVENEFAFRDAPDAAAVFVEAARAKKFDVETGQFLDEFDEDFFRMATAAMMGNGTAVQRLTTDVRGQEIADAIKAMQTTRISALDDAVRESERRLDETLTDPNLTGFQRYDRAMHAEQDFALARRKADEANEQLRSYLDYEQWHGALTQRAEQNVLSMRAVPGTGAGFGQSAQRTYVYRPTGANGLSATSTQVPRNTWRKRPGIIDFHRPNDTYETASRYMDSALAYGGRQGADSFLQAHGVDNFEIVRRDLLNKAANAATDVERRAVAGRMEETGIEIVARKHGYTTAEARAMATQIRGVKSKLFRDIEQQHAANTAYSAADDSIKYKWMEGDVLHEAELPLTLTQLQNTFIPTDLRALDSLLTRHGDAIRNDLRSVLKTGGRAAADDVERALIRYNQFWKPSVLFRLGYPARTVSDEMLRVLALSGSFTHMLGQMPQAAAIGAANVPLRTRNLLRSGLNRDARRRWENRNPDVLRGKDLDPSWSFIDKGRKDLIERSTSMASRYREDLLSASVKGGKPPKAPAIVRKIEQEVSTGNPFAIDVATGRKLNPKAIVGDFGFERAEVIKPGQGGVGAAIADFAYRNSDRLSHADGVLMVSHTDEGLRLSVGRKGPKWRQPVRTISQPGFGTKKPSVKLKAQTGDKYEFGAPFKVGEGDMYAATVSSGSYWQNLRTTHETNVGMLRANAMGARHSVLGKADYTEVWADTINRQLFSDPIVRRYLDGNTADDIATWLRTTREGRQYAKRIPWRSHDPIKWTDEIEQHVNALLPTDALRAQVRAGQKVTKEQLDQMLITRQVDLPASIDQASVDLALGEGVIGNAIGRFVERGYHVLGTLPTDTLIRQPFFRSQYQNRLQGLVDTLPEGTVLTDKAVKAMERGAREFAVKQTRRYLFSLADETDFTHSLRFLSPFMNAWQEALTRWATILMERPQALSRIWLNGWNQMHEFSFFEMVDENGLTKDDPDHGELEFIRVPWLPQMVKAMDKFLPGDQAAAAQVLGYASINKQSMNTVLQGSPWWLPSGGPLVQYPAKYLIGHHPEWETEGGAKEWVYKYLFPTGVPENADAVLPAGWMQQWQRYSKGMDDPVFINLASTIYKQEWYDWNASGRVGPEPTANDSVRKAEAIQAFMIAGRFLSPASFDVKVPGQFFIDAANRIQADPNLSFEEKVQKFTEEYGDDAYLWWYSNSKSNIGNVPATAEGFEGYQEYQALIEEFPELGGAIVGEAANEGEFNFSVYNWQQNNPVSPSDPRPQRERQGPTDSLARAQSSDGWRRWTQFNQALDTELAARGLTNLQQKGAEDLAMTKQYFVQQLAQELPGWYDAYNSFDRIKSYRLVEQFDKAIQSGQAPDRPDWHGVAQYVDLHRMFGAELDARSMAGGSRDIEAASNEDLEMAWNFAVGQLTQENLMFADLYHRYLDNHTLTMGSG